MQNHDAVPQSTTDRKKDVPGGSPELPATSLDSQADSQIVTEAEDGTRSDPFRLPDTELTPMGDSQIVTEPGPAIEPGDVRGPSGPDAEEVDPLLEFFELCEERCRLDQDATTESVGVRDPAEREAASERIDRQMKLLAVLNFSGVGDAARPGGVAVVPEEGRARGPTSTAAQTFPAFIGRYRVIRILGKGGFGIVYLAHDAELDRDVAIKVPVDSPASRFVDVESYLEEARLLARLSHPNIVPVHDVGRTDDGRCYVVSKYMEGGDVAARLRQGRPAFRESAELIAIVCEALHYTHTHDLFHRDIKPANILLDRAGVPSLADFGLALKDEDVGKGTGYVGTAAYMSPEQARGEGHRVDGRSDIFSIGIVLYELLTLRRPFRGGTKPEVMQQIVHAEPRPPRQIDDTIPRELERICLKALAKRASERYSTARDLAEDLLHFLKTATTTAASPPPVGSPAPTIATESAPTPISGPSESAGHSIKIVPKGLGSFDQDDAGFFLELLPGQRDRDGLPDGLRFWKTRIEATDPDRAFRVGLIYGPSGCGKSSMVKAGLIPLLSRHVAPVYVEATAGETEARLLRGIRKRIPALPVDVGLVESLAILRRGQGLKPGRKVLLVVDQFEQWLSVRRGEPGTELIAALRQCDGEHLQALCLVRDDFWMAATRFMKDLEIDLVPDRNVAAVDLFAPSHARKVLAAIGRAFEALPPRAGDLTKDQDAFLRQAVAGLEQDGQVVPVRLALFAEMVKRKPWKLATLRDIGGMSGVGVTFHEETFSSARSNPNHRYHLEAAQAVLKALLPETNADIKGRMRSVEELRDLSGYAARPTDFADLVRTLDNDLRLITPVDPESSIDEDQPALPVGGLYYQLTHDYLIHALQEWLTRKKRETRRGRAELLLAERAALWTSRPEDRHLPSTLEWATIRILTKPNGWADPQRRMMRRSDRLIGLRGVCGALLIAGLLVAGLAIRAHGLLQSLLIAETAQVAASIRDLNPYRWWVAPALRRIVEDEPDDSKAKLHASLALLRDDVAQVKYVYKRLLAADPSEVDVLSRSLLPFKSGPIPWLWDEVEKGNDKSLLQAAGALALYDPDNPQWAPVCGKVARAMAAVNPIHVSTWREILRPIKHQLQVPLKEIYRDKNPQEADRGHAAIYLVDYAAEDATELVDLLLDAESNDFTLVLNYVHKHRQRVIPLLEREIRAVEGLSKPVEIPPKLAEEARDRQAERRANAAVALVCLGAGTEVWPLLVHSPDPRLRSFIINWLAPLSADIGSIRDHLMEAGRGAGPRPAAVKPAMEDPNGSILFDETTSIRRALIQALGYFDPARLGGEDRRRMIEELLVLYRDDPDAGIHGAAGWTLRRWGQEARSREIASELARISEKEQTGGPGYRRWFVNRQAQTMVIVDGPLEFRMGAPDTEPDRVENEIPHSRKIRRPFAIAAHEVSVEQFEDFWKEHAAEFVALEIKPDARRDWPQWGVSWYMAAAYCNWLSEKEGRTPVYEPIDGKRFAAGMRVKPGAFDRGGYRLPTEAEWEYACRSGAVTSRYYGNSWRLIRKYARLTSWEAASPIPCGSLLPNDLGLFDMLGNLSEWCHDRRYDYADFRNGSASDFPAEDVINSPYRILRGAAFSNRPPSARSASRTGYEPDVSYGIIGFRPAKSCP
jgi:eukaryotic-like serine/threonine-protein kinase